MSARRLIAALTCALSLSVGTAGVATATLKHQGPTKPPGLDTSVFGLIKDMATGGYFFNRMKDRTEKAVEALDFFFEIKNAAGHLSNNIAYWRGPDPIEWNWDTPPGDWYHPMKGAPPVAYPGDINYFPFAWKDWYESYGIKSYFCANTLAVWMKPDGSGRPQENKLPLDITAREIAEAQLSPSIDPERIMHPGDWEQLDLIVDEKVVRTDDGESAIVVVASRAYPGKISRVLVDLPPCFYAHIPVGAVARIVRVKDRAGTFHLEDREERRTLPCPEGFHGGGVFQKRVFPHKIDLLGRDHTVMAMKKTGWYGSSAEAQLRAYMMAHSRTYEHWKKVRYSDFPPADEGWETTADTCVADKTYEKEWTGPLPKRAPQPEKTVKTTTESREQKGIPCGPGFAGTFTKQWTRTRTEVTVVYPWDRQHPVKTTTYGEWSPWRTVQMTCMRELAPKPHPAPHKAAPGPATVKVQGGYQTRIQYMACFPRSGRWDWTGQQSLGKDACFSTTHDTHKIKQPGQCEKPPFFSFPGPYSVGPRPCPAGYHHLRFEADGGWGMMKPGHCHYNPPDENTPNPGVDKRYYSRVCVRGPGPRDTPHKAKDGYYRDFPGGSPFVGSWPPLQ